MIFYGLAKGYDVVETPSPLSSHFPTANKCIMEVIIHDSLRAKMLSWQKKDYYEQP